MMKHEAILIIFAMILVLFIEIVTVVNGTSFNTYVVGNQYKEFLSKDRIKSNFLGRKGITMVDSNDIDSNGTIHYKSFIELVYPYDSKKDIKYVTGEELNKWINDINSYLKHRNDFDGFNLIKVSKDSITDVYSSPLKGNKSFNVVVRKLDDDMYQVVIVVKEDEVKNE